jgi:hypothetical protein
MPGIDLAGNLCLKDSSRLLLQIPFRQLFLLCYLLLPILLLILLASVSHCLPPFVVQRSGLYEQERKRAESWVASAPLGQAGR